MPSASPKPETTDIRTRILREATRLFAERGYEGTSVQAVADAVDIRKPSLLYHFSSKAALRDAVTGTVLERWKEVLPRLMLAATSGADRFDAIVGEVVSFFEDDPDRARLLLREALDRPLEMKRRLKDELAPWLAMLAQYIEQGVEEGIIHADIDAEAFVIQAIHVIIGSLSIADVMGAALEGTDDRERVIRELKRLLRTGLFIPKPTDAGTSDDLTSDTRTSETSNG